MRLLAIETSTAASSVALGEGRRMVAYCERITRRGHEGFLVPALDFCFDQAGWKPDDVDAVIVGVGPGLFTGIRVGLATAQGIAAAVGAPIVPASSLDALAIRAATGRRYIWSVVDVRRGQLAIGPYHPVPGGVVKEGAPELVTPEQLRGILETVTVDVLLVGDLEPIEADLRGLQRVRIGRPRYPSAEALLELAVQQVEREDFPRREEVRPLYLREPAGRSSTKHFKANRDFHLALVEATGNLELVQFMEHVWIGRIGATLYESRLDPAGLEADHQAHESIAAAIEAGEPEEAETLTRGHLLRAMELIFPGR